MATSCFAEPLVINGTPVADMAQLSLTWADAPIGGATVQRLCDGSAVKQIAWRKRKLTLSATGLVPSGLQAVNWSLPVSVSGPRLAQLTGFSDGPQERFDHFAALWSWQLTIEEM